MACRSFFRSLRPTSFAPFSAAISYALFGPRTSFSRSVTSSGCRSCIRDVTASIAQVAAAPAAAPIRMSTASGRLLRGTFDALLHRADELRSVERLDDHLADLVELPAGNVPRICGGHDDARDELRFRRDQLPQHRESIDARHHQIEDDGIEVF